MPKHTDFDARLGVRVTSDHQDQLRWVARVTGRPVAEVLRDALDQHLDRLRADEAFRHQVRAHEAREAEQRARFRLPDRIHEVESPQVADDPRDSDDV